jgi:hypothetical protein
MRIPGPISHANRGHGQPHLPWRSPCTTPTASLQDKLGQEGCQSDSPSDLDVRNEERKIHGSSYHAERSSRVGIISRSTTYVLPVIGWSYTRRDTKAETPTQPGDTSTIDF